ncbi:pheromone receptor [Macrolepiota fuliginosa MF-IS2]|uniref:Pheromone receptor n=1 Tax=Macrolepiota fuliginosa MF-IS2 TaxID=1400762 RepID=A0A9P5X105_9AGAR|nr:pheromone receptor [Macrolepiota fuliginosa MF-IS2]
MVDATYPLYPTLAFLGFILALVPLPWHLKAWNSGTCFYMMWASLACLNQFVNSVVWHKNAVNWAPIWCEISIRIMMGSSVGLPASSLCINRRLYYIITSSSAAVTPNEKKRAIMIDSLICVLFPLIYIALQYIVQGHRFNIYEDVGCFPALFNSLPVYFISLMWPLLIGCISAVYCTLTLYTFARRRLEFSRILASHPSITPWRYFRLMALAMTELMLTMPLAAFVIWLNATAEPIEPWVNWADTHFRYSRVEMYPALLWRRSSIFVASMEFTRWVVPACVFIFFGFFGFAEEARKNYVTGSRKISSVFRQAMSIG